MRSNFSILFYIKKSQPRRTGTFMIYGRITLNQKEAVFTTKIEVSAEDWACIERGQNIRSARAKEAKQRMDIIRAKAQEHFWTLYERGLDPDADSIKNLLTGVKQEEETLLVLFDKHNDLMRQMVGQTVGKETYGRYLLTRERLASFLKEKRRVNDISIRKVSLDFIQEFEVYLRITFGVNTNMIYKYMQYLKKIVRNAFHSGIIHAYPFGEYKLKKVKVRIGFLTEQELMRLMTKSFGVERLEQLRDIFVFCCFTGLAYADVRKLTTDEIRLHMGGEKWILTSRAKNDNEVNVRLFNIPKMILQKYENKVTGRYVLPVISNQKTNAYLKEIALLCNIDKNLTFHTARHTFATTVMLCNGASMEVLQKTLGHDDIKDTQIYGKIVDIRVAREMEQVAPQLQDYDNVFAEYRVNSRRIN